MDTKALNAFGVVALAVIAAYKLGYERGDRDMRVYNGVPPSLIRRKAA